MLRKIIKIDKDKCNGCGACAKACHEGAIEMINGKAVLTREDYCDGLGDCLPACPVDAISFEEREAKPYDEAAVLTAKAQKSTLPCGCPSANSKVLRGNDYTAACAKMPSRLCQWPCQIKLIPENAPYFEGADLLVAADCTAFACGSLHEDFMKNRITLIGCPKLDSVDYSEKLARIFTANQLRSITVVRMEVPCCSGIENAVKKALAISGKTIPLQISVISTNGKIIS